MGSSIIDNLTGEAFTIQMDNGFRQRDEKQWKKDKEQAWLNVYTAVIDWRDDQRDAGKKPLDPLEGYK